MKFEESGLSPALLRAVSDSGYTVPTPIQVQAIPHVLAGRDVWGCAQTGTGKTAAFALPILHRLQASRPTGDAKPPRRMIRALVLSPTRELAVQIDESFNVYGRHTGLRSTVIYGGVSQNPQARALRQGVDVLVATPGRLLDLINQGLVKLDRVESFVLDEADRMLDMGFIHDIRKIIGKLPKQRQSLLFSATMPDDIRQLSSSMLRDPVSVQVAQLSGAADTVAQTVYFVAKQSKPKLLAHFLDETTTTRTLVFARTRHGAERLAKHLSRAGIRADSLHGDKSQAARQRALTNFKSQFAAVLVATDIAARGLDIDEISHVVNYDVPQVPETYVHRIGRTGRAGASGQAVSFCDPSERMLWRAIERMVRKPISVSATPAACLGSEPMEGDTDRPEPQGGPAGRKQRPGRSGRGGGGGGHGGKPKRTNVQRAAAQRSGGQRPAAQRPAAKRSGDPAPSGPRATVAPVKAGAVAVKPPKHRPGKSPAFGDGIVLN